MRGIAMRLGRAPSTVSREVASNGGRLEYRGAVAHRASWTTGGSFGLKAVAPLAGSTWPVDDADGGMSMVYHARMLDPATTAEEQAQLQAWLLDYNRGDVEATLAIRDWLDADGSQLPVATTA